MSRDEDRDTSHDKAPDDVDLLVPWHATERLSPEEATRLEAAIARDPAIARNLAAAREERAETVALNQGLGLPSARAREALFARIAAEAGPDRRPGLLERLRGALAGLSPGVLMGAGAAAARVIALQAGFLAQAYLHAPSGTGYETASAPTVESARGRFALVAFAPEATAGRIEALLRETGARIVDGPRPGGVYRLRLADEGIAPEALAGLVERLRGSGAVRLVAPESLPPAR